MLHYFLEKIEFGINSKIYIFIHHTYGLNCSKTLEKLGDSSGENNTDFDFWDIPSYDSDDESGSDSDTDTDSDSGENCHGDSRDNVMQRHSKPVDPACRPQSKLSPKLRTRTEASQQDTRFSIDQSSHK